MTALRSASDGVSDRVVTLPNAISLARLLAVPVFGYLVLVDNDLAALVVLLLASVSDFVDGALARALHQVSRLGVLLDPIADRAYVLVAIGALAWRDTVPWLFVAVLLARDVALAVNIALLRRGGFAPLPVHTLGKAATFVLFWGFPLLLLSSGIPQTQAWALPLAWAALLWGAGLYWWAGIGYLIQGRRVLRSPQPESAVTP